MTTNVNEMPDPDAIKMFIGQIPKSWNENDVRMYFEQYGPIYMVNVLRDKMTKQSRGMTLENLKVNASFINFLTLPKLFAIF